MYDTIKVSLNDYNIDSSNKIEVKQPNKINNIIDESRIITLFRDNAGNSYKGVGAYLNLDNCQVDISPFTTNDRPTIFVKFSLPKVYNGGETNISNGIDKTDIKPVIESIEKELADNGIHTNIHTSNLSRLDMFKDIETDLPYNNYGKVFELLSLQRATEWSYDNTYYSGNGQQSIKIYDKRQEQLDKLKKNNPIDIDELLRIELSYTNKRKITNSLEFSALKSIYLNYDVINEHFRDKILKSLFNSPDSFQSALIDDVEHELRYYRKDNNRQYLSNYLKSKGVDYVIDKIGMDNFLDTLRLITNKDKQVVYRAKKDIEKRRLVSVMLDKTRMDGKTYIDLYNELHGKFIA